MKREEGNGHKSRIIVFKLENNRCQFIWMTHKKAKVTHLPSPILCKCVVRVAIIVSSSSLSFPYSLVRVNDTACEREKERKDKYLSSHECQDDVVVILFPHSNNTYKKKKQESSECHFYSRHKKHKKPRKWEKRDNSNNFLELPCFFETLSNALV